MMNNAGAGQYVAVWVELADAIAPVPEPLSVAAAIRSAGDLRERFSSLVRTSRPPSYRARVIAGRSRTELEGAPIAANVGERLRKFTGRLPIVVGGGKGATGALVALLGDHHASPVLDLAELLELLHAELAQVDLIACVSQLELSTPANAPKEDLVGAVYDRMTEEAALVEPRIINEILGRALTTDWPLQHFFTSIGSGSAAALDTEVWKPERISKIAAAAESRPPAARPVPRSKVESGGVVETLAAATSAGEHGYEPRQQQLEMTAAVAAALEGDYHLLVEAGTGTGKSVAYLLPAACHALRTAERVLISTNTINLQEQLTEKDIPSVRDLLASYGPADLRSRASTLRSVTLKGRRNYLCLQRLATLRRTPVLTEVEVRFLAKVLLWLARGGGDRAGLRLTPEEESVWLRVCADGSVCFAASSPFVRNGSCQLMQARRRAEAADIVVVNHSLLLSDLAAERNILPAYDRLVVDEAHNLEDIATDQFGFHAGQGELTTLLDAVATRGRDRESGLVADVRTAIRSQPGDGDRAFLEAVVQDLVERTERARSLSPEAFSVVAAFARLNGQADGDYDRRLLLTRGARSQPDWTQVELAWENLQLALTQVEDGLERLGIALAERTDESILDREALLGAIGSQTLSIRVVREGIDGVINRHDDQRVCWLTVNRTGGTVTIASAPLNVGEMLDSYLFGRKSSVVLTSATLTANASFAYVRDRLGLTDAEELALGSPFDYERAALLLLPADMPEPSHPAYQAALERAIIELCLASEGRALVLFTSHSALRATQRAIRPRLAAAEIRVLAQGIDGTPQELLGALRREQRTVVCGTSSFWEGVDVVGEALSLLVIAKLPFSVPSDPVFAARGQLFDDPFREYALPQAILRFKQGFGRLIRHRGDRGVVAVLDRRLRSKSYGRAFIKSLPPCTLREAAVSEIGPAVRQWLSSD